MDVRTCVCVCVRASIYVLSLESYIDMSMMCGFFVCVCVAMESYLILFYFSFINNKISFET